MSDPKRRPIVSSDGGKRRLRVVQQDDEGSERPAWHWIAIGAVGAMLALIPLLMVFQALAKMEMSRLVPGDDPERATAALRALGTAERIWFFVVAVGAQLLPMALATFAGGLLVGRFGGAAGLREATWTGLSTGVLVALIGASSTLGGSGSVAVWIASAVLLIGVGTLAARRGGRLGLRLRERA